MAKLRNILITGAAGYLGGVLRKGLSDSYRLRLTDRVSLPVHSGDYREFVLADLEDTTALAAAIEGVDAIVHLGAAVDEANWAGILSANIAGTYNIFEIARQSGVRRIVFASSHHVAGFYPRTRKIDTTVPARPDGKYAVSKVFGEALGRLYADKYGMSVICQRIGVARPKPPHRRSLSNWLSEGDYVELTRRCLEADNVHFVIVYGVSRSASTFYDTADGMGIGYDPADTADLYRGDIAITSAQPEGPIERLFQGGAYCAAGFSSDPSKIT